MNAFWRLGLGTAAALLFAAALACTDSGSASPSGSPPPPVAAATSTPQASFDAGVVLEEFPPGGPRNEVRIENDENMRFKARASIRLHRIETDDVKPVNIAFAQGHCTDCQTIAVAVQIVFYRRDAHTVVPENIALASNVGCTRCVTAARAIQYVIPVNDPKSDLPPEIDRLVKDMDRELRFLASIKTWDQITSDDAQARIQRVLDQYADLKQFLREAMQTARAENATPAPTDSSAPSPTPAATPAGTVAPTASPTPTATP
jgi:hypothetical protein